MSEGIYPRKFKGGGQSWLVKYDIAPDPTTGQRRTRCKTVRGSKKEAESVRRKLLEAVKEGTHVDTSKKAFAEYARHWLDNIAATKVSAKTLERYREIVETNIIPVIGETRLQKLTTAHVESLYSQAQKSGRRDGRGLSTTTVRHMHVVLSAILVSASKKRLIQTNPMEDVESVPKAATPEIKTLDSGEVQTLLRTARGTDLYAPVLLAAATGMRRGEVLGLRWSDIDFERRVLAVRQSLEETRQDDLRIKSPKTASGVRTIILPEFAIAALRGHRREQAERRLAVGLGSNKRGLVFTDLDGNPRSPNKLTKGFGRLVKRAGVARITLHGLRHTHATQLLLNNVHVKTVSERLGHANITITLETYAHVLPSMQQDAADKLDAMFGALAD